MPARFGVFTPKQRPARKARNPRTQEVLDVPPATVPVFTAGKTFKDKVKANGKA
jgi:DNA-binding protein HU-beta